jgi:DNA replication initiation complex subunit (GINS family)
MSLDIGNINLDELGDIVKKAQLMVDEKMSGLTAEEKRQVDNIVKGVDMNDNDSIKNKIDELNKNKDASRS